MCDSHTLGMFYFSYFIHTKCSILKKQIPEKKKNCKWLILISHTVFIPVVSYKQMSDAQVSVHTVREKKPVPEIHIIHISICWCHELGQVSGK